MQFLGPNFYLVFRNNCFHVCSFILLFFIQVMRQASRKRKPNVLKGVILKHGIDIMWRKNAKKLMIQNLFPQKLRYVVTSIYTIRALFCFFEGELAKGLNRRKNRLKSDPLVSKVNIFQEK